MKKLIEYLFIIVAFGVHRLFYWIRGEYIMNIYKNSDEHDLVYNYDKDLPLTNGDTSGCGGKRFNTGKLEWHLLPFEALKGTVKVLMFGKTKYGEGNWQKGMGWITVYNSLIRHVIAWRNGEDLDTESGEHHMSHIICNAIFLLWYTIKNKGIDDRKKEEPV